MSRSTRGSHGLVAGLLLGFLLLVPPLALSAQSWPDWGPVLSVTGDYVEWTEDEDGTVHGVLEGIGDTGFVYLAVTAGGEYDHYRLPFVRASTQTVGRIAVVPFGREILLAVHATEDQVSTIHLYRLGELAAAREVLVGTQTAGSVEMGAVGTRGWTVRASENEPGMELVFVVNGPEGGTLRRVRLDAELEPQSNDTVYQGRRITEIAGLPSEPVIAWREIDRTSSSVVTGVLPFTAGASVTRLAETDAGRPLLLSPGLSFPTAAFGRNVEFANKPRLALSSYNGRLAVAYLYIDRERSQLSNYVTGVNLLTVGGPPEAVNSYEIVPPIHGALFTSFNAVITDSKVAVSFLNEQLAPQLATDFYVATSAWGEDRFAARNLTSTPRVVAAPWISSRNGALRYLWLQSQPEGFAPIQEYATESPLRERLPLVLQGLPAETVTSALVALPIAVLVGLYHSLIGSAPALLLAYLLLAAVQRFRPELQRERGRLVTSLVFAAAVLSVGLPPLSFAPLPPSALPGIVSATIGLMVILWWYARRSQRALPTASQITAAIALALVAVTSTGAYYAVMEGLQDTGQLPAVLG